MKYYEESYTVNGISYGALQFSNKREAIKYAKQQKRESLHHKENGYGDPDMGEIMVWTGDDDYNIDYSIDPIYHITVREAAA